MFDRTTATLTCVRGTYLRVVHVTVTSSRRHVTAGRVLVAHRLFNLLTLFCPTNSATCVLPVSGTGSARVVDATQLGVSEPTSGVMAQLLDVQFACIHLTSPGNC